MRDSIQAYLPMVQFLSTVLGKNYEIVLIELKDKGSGIVAIENAHISGRKIGDGLTDLLLKYIKEEFYRDSDFQCNYTCLSHGRRLRGSTYFIKEGEMLVGMLCINFDAESFLDLDARLMQLANLQPQTLMDTIKISDRCVQENQVETVFSSVTELCEQEVLKFAEERNLRIDQFTQEHNLEIMENLNNKGIFLIKGIVPDVASILRVSEASVYRYLSKINKKRV